MGDTHNKHLLDISQKTGSICIQIDRNYCRLPILQIECEDRLGVPECRDKGREETFVTKSHRYWKNQEQTSFRRDYTIKYHSSVYSMETQSNSIVTNTT